MGAKKVWKNVRRVHLTLGECPALARQDSSGRLVLPFKGQAAGSGPLIFRFGDRC